MDITQRELNLAYDTLLLLSSGSLNPENGSSIFRSAADSLLIEIAPQVKAFRKLRDEDLVIKYGRREGDLEKFKLSGQDKAAVVAYRQETTEKLNEVVTLKIKDSAQISLLQQIILMKLMFFQGDFPEI